MSQRPSKFTPERVQQIKDLVARGTSCEEIATLIGVTVGTLKVTCSRLGISLRKPRSRTGLDAAEGGNPCAAIGKHSPLQRLCSVQRQSAVVRNTADAHHGRATGTGGCVARSENQ